MNGLSRNRIIAFALLAVAALAFVIAPSARTQEQPTQPVSSTPSAKCALASVRLNSRTPKAGDELMATVTVENCSADKERVIIQFSYTDPCGNTTAMGSAPLKLAAAEKQDSMINFLAPAAECPGDFKVSASIVADGKELTNASTTFKVAGN